MLGALPAEDRFRHDAEHPLPQQLVVVDEASMVDTHVLTRLQAQADTAGARVVLMGDPHQLGAVGAGGMMQAAVDRDAETYTLSDVRRFTAAWEAQASIRLRAGDVTAVEDYDAHGRIIDAGTEYDAIQAIARAAAADVLAGRETVVVTATNDHAAAVAAAVRAHLVAAGRVGDGAAVLRDRTTAGIGDVVQARRIDRGLGLVNRETYRVTGITPDGALHVQSTRTGRTHVMPPGYAAADVTLAYASTAHGAQGRTVDSGHVLLTPDLERAGAYVGLTRGRSSNIAWAITHDPTRTTGDDLTHHGDLGERGERGEDRVATATMEQTARGALARALTTRDADTSHAAGGWQVDPDRAAIDQAAADAARARDTATLLGLLAEEVHQAGRARLDGDLDTLTREGLLTVQARARFGADQGSEHLVRLLRAHEHAGADPTTVLRQALTDPRGLDDAVSVAQVVAARIDRTRPLPLPTPGPLTPGGLTGERAGYVASLHALLVDRQAHLGATAAEDPPEWATTHLGPVPTDPTERAAWQDRAGVIAAHREATGWTHPTQPVGRCPGLHTPEHRAAWHAAYTAAGMPEHRRPEAAMPLGQLLVRARAGDRVLDHAPPVVYDAQRHHHQHAAEARREADLARAHDRHEVAAARDAQAGDHTAAADRLDDIAQARAAYLAAHYETTSAAQAAHVELHRRGHHPTTHDENQRPTAAEWLAAERAARTADDPHRAITPADLADTLHAHATDADSTDADPDPAAAPAADSRAPDEAARANGRRPSRHDIQETTTKDAAASAAAARPADGVGEALTELSADAAEAEILAASRHAALTRERLADAASQDATEATAAADDADSAAEGAASEPAGETDVDSEWLYLSRRAADQNAAAAVNARADHD
ncbi:MAG: AAA family ATPase [Kineosporiaceae bacterium]